MAFSNIEGDFICEACGKHFIKRQSFFAHKGSHSKKKKRVPWNKGLTKESDARVKKAGETYSQTQKGVKRNALSSEHKISISKSMSKAHQEGRAHNIGKSRWNSKQSYPESFFEKVIISAKKQLSCSICNPDAGQLSILQQPRIKNETKYTGENHGLYSD